MATYVLVHGAWHGGWCWREVAQQLRAVGHEVHTPTLTGLGERTHLLAPDVDLGTHVQDLIAVLEHERLNDVYLVAHSYAGMPATVAAVEAALRVRRLICLDGFLPESGEAAIELLPEHAAAHYRESAVEQDGAWVIPPRPLERLGVRDDAVIRDLSPRLVPHPLSTYTEPARKGAKELPHPGTYLQCTGWASPFGEMKARAHGLGWRTGEVDGDHEVMATDPDRLVRHLLAEVDNPIDAEPTEGPR